MDLVFDAHGRVQCLYSEAIDLSQIGVVEIRRAAHVEPQGLRGWRVDLRPSGSPMVGPYPLRSTALAAEAAWLRSQLLAERPIGQTTNA